MSRPKHIDLYRGKDPRELPAYGLVEAAHYLRLPVQTVRQWLYGRPLSTGRRTKPLVRPAALSTTDDRAFVTFNGVNAQLESRLAKTIPKTDATHAHLCFYPGNKVGAESTRRAGGI